MAIRVSYATHKLSRNIRFEVHDLGTLISLVREGLGISIVPRISFPKVPDGVALIPLRPRLARELGLVMRPRAQSSPEVQAFIRKAREIADEIVKGTRTRNAPFSRPPWMVFGELRLTLLVSDLIGRLGIALLGPHHAVEDSITAPS